MYEVELPKKGDARRGEHVRRRAPATLTSLFTKKERKIGFVFLGMSMR